MKRKNDTGLNFIFNKCTSLIGEAKEKNWYVFDGNVEHDGIIDKVHYIEHAISPEQALNFVKMHERNRLHHNNFKINPKDISLDFQRTEEDKLKNPVNFTIFNTCPIHNVRLTDGGSCPVCDGEEDY